MKFFKVTSEYYDTGAVTATLEPVEADEKPRDTYQDNQVCDRYCEYYEDERIARRAYNALKRA